MMLKITERCTMGCTHCLNNAQPDGKDMTEAVFIDSLNFLKNNNVGKFLVLSGGEPTEHRNFDKMMNVLIQWCQQNRGYIMSLTITTNGENIQNNPEQYRTYIEKLKETGTVLTYQVSADVRYYPRRIQTHKRIFREPGFVLCDDCVEAIYPKGRALENNIPWNRISSQCFNVRALSKQGNDSLSEIEYILGSRGKICTPHIGIDGSIKLGESDLCPPCTSIYDDSNIIMEKIRNFKCSGCNHINDNLPEEYKKFL